MKIAALLKILLFTLGLNGRWGLPFCFWGDPGIGKSIVVQNVCKAGKMLCIVIIAGIREPSDFLGLPIPDGEGSMSYAAPSWAKAVANADRAVVFIDEIGSVAPAVQAALMRVVNEGVVGDLQLPPSVRFVLAGNPVGSATAGFELAPPMANRMGHKEMGRPDADAWQDWLLSSGNGVNTQEDFDPAALEKYVKDNWDKTYAIARGTIAGYIKRNPGELMQMPDRTSNDSSRAWASPRSIEMACRIYAGCMIHGADETTTDDLIACFAGRAFASGLAAFRANADLPDPHDLLDGKAEFEHDASRLDRTLVVFNTCAAIVSKADCPKRKERATRLWEIMEPVAKQSTDVVVPAARSLVAARLSGIKAARPTLAKFKKVMVAAGLIQV